MRSRGHPASLRIAHLAHAPQARIDLLAGVWVAARVSYVGFYLSGRSTLRSSAQFVALGCVLGLFVIAGMAT